MKRNILIYRYIDIFNPTDYINLPNTMKRKFNGECPNFGNKLWYQAIISLVTTDDNNCEFYNEKITADEINEKYDLVLYPMANIFNLEYKNNLKALAEFFRKIKIPTFIVSCGAQAKSYDDLNDLCEQIGEPAKEFIKAIYQTGGEFALRGYFTKSFFDKLGFKTAQVVGCPSLFQLGRKFEVSNKKVTKSEFKPVINGHGIDLYEKIFIEYPRSVFLDQDQFSEQLYNPAFWNIYFPLSFKNKLKFVKHFGFLFAKMLSEERIKLIADMNPWRQYLIDNGFNFSFGSRIHGNIMSILSGIPAVVLSVDTRTQEMAEFYEIPLINQTSEKLPFKDIYEDLYMPLDYSKFNNNYAEKYDNFISFLKKCGIVSEMNPNNKFFNNDSTRLHKMPVIENQQKINEMYDKIKKDKLVNLGSKFLR